jgi:hypothetical protein
MKILLPFIALVIFSLERSFAQEKPDTVPCPTKDIGDIIHGNKPSTKKHPQKNYFIFLTPVVGSAPNSGEVFTTHATSAQFANNFEASDRA